MRRSRSEEGDGRADKRPDRVRRFGVDSRDGRSEDASSVSLRVIDKEHFDSAKEVVVGRTKGAGKAVEGTSHSGNSIAAAHEGGAVLNSEKFEVAR